MQRPFAFHDLTFIFRNTYFTLIVTESKMSWIFKRLLDRILAGAIHKGQFRVIWPDASESNYGDGQGLKAGIRIQDNATLRRLVLHPGLAIGEAYMDQNLVPIEGSIF